MLRDVVRRRRWAHSPMIHAASHLYHEKRVAWVSISMHACDPVPIVMGLRLAALQAAGTPLISIIIKITISSLVIGLKMSYFPLIRLLSCYRTVCYWIVCYWTVCYRTV